MMTCRFLGAWIAMALCSCADAQGRAQPAPKVAIKRVVPHQTMAYAERGAACGGAKDKVACLRELRELEKTAAPAAISCPGSGDCPQRTYVLTTHGDTPQLCGSPEQIRRLLGPIDTADDAWLLAQAVENATPYAATATSARVRGRERL